MHIVRTHWYLSVKLYNSKPDCKVSALHFFVKWLQPMASWPRARSDECFFPILIPGLTPVLLLKSKSRFRLLRNSQTPSENVPMEVYWWFKCSQWKKKKHQTTRFRITVLTLRSYNSLVRYNTFFHFLIVKKEKDDFHDLDRMCDLPSFMICNSHCWYPSLFRIPGDPPRCSAVRFCVL
jgi:hypothetical protein